MINYYWISVKGKSTKYFLYALFKNNINIADIKYKKDEVFLKLSYEEYKEVLKINTSCSISIYKIVGFKRIGQLYQKYKVSLIIFVIDVFFILFISNLILFINIEADNNYVKNTIRSELIDKNITFFTFKKSYKDLKSISLSIKNNNLDIIEWIELEQKGVFLNVKVIPRIKKENSNYKGYNDIIASKSGYIKKIESSKGQVLKNIDDYVKKGEVIVSGNIFRNDKVVGKVNANGKVFAEVWYVVKANNDLSYTKVIKSNKGKIGFSIFIKNREIRLLYLPKKIITNKSVNLFTNENFSIILKKEIGYVKKEEKYHANNLQLMLEQRAKNSILKSLGNDEYIISQKTLKKYFKNGKMYIEVFFKCYQDIAEEKTLQKIKEKKDGLND